MNNNCRGSFAKRFAKPSNKKVFQRKGKFDAGIHEKVFPGKEMEKMNKCNWSELAEAQASIHAHRAAVKACQRSSLAPPKPVVVAAPRKYPHDLGPQRSWSYTTLVMSKLLTIHVGEKSVMKIPPSRPATTTGKLRQLLAKHPVHQDKFHTV